MAALLQEVSRLLPDRNPQQFLAQDPTVRSINRTGTPALLDRLCLRAMTARGRAATRALKHMRTMPAAEGRGNNDAGLFAFGG